MKTTSKEFYTQVHAHIIDRLGNPWNEATQSENENATTAEKLQNVVNEFNSWYCPYERRLTPNHQAAFWKFLMGLPSCLAVEFAYYSMRETLRTWHNQTEAEAAKYTDDQIVAAYSWLIYREFSRLCKQYKITF